MAKKDADGYSLGNRKDRPHSDKGWNPSRDGEKEGELLPNPGYVRGKSVGYGYHEAGDKK